MRPLITSGQAVTLRPITDSKKLTKGDVVLVKVQGNIYLHQIKARQGDRLQIGNMRGRINGWVNDKAPYGQAEL